MNRNSFLSYKTFTVPATSTRIHNTTGAFFSCKESSAQFKMRVDDGEMFPMEVGLGFRLDGQDTFKKLTFINDTATDTTIEYYAGSSQVHDTRLNSLITRGISLKDPTTVAISYDLTLTTGQIYSIPSNPSFGLTSRKQLIITNLDTTLDLNVRTGTAGVDLGAVVFPRSAWTLETSSVIYIHNPDVTNTLHCLLCMTFYIS